jgi:hypothetical protein
MMIKGILNTLASDPSVPTNQPYNKANPGANPYGKIGQELLNVPFGEMIKSMGYGVAEAQHSMDMVSAGMAQLMAGMPIAEAERDETGKRKTRDAIWVDIGGEKLSLLELGFTPTFYQFTEAVIDIKLTFNFNSQAESSMHKVNLNAGVGYSQNADWQQFLGAETGSLRLNISTMNSKQMSKYSIKAEGVSSMKATMVPVPPPESLMSTVTNAISARNAELTLDSNTIKIDNTTISGASTITLEFSKNLDPFSAKNKDNYVFKSNKTHNIESATVSKTNKGQVTLVVKEPYEQDDIKAGLKLELKNIKDQYEHGKAYSGGAVQVPEDNDHKWSK